MQWYIFIYSTELLSYSFDSSDAYIDGLVQDCSISSISIVNAQEILQSCTKQSVS